jgi:short-subunit dehydrogenase
VTGSALVTGASSGLGREFARALAARGHDLVLVARRRARLESLRDELVARDGVDVDIVACDLATDAGLADCRAAIAPRQITVAVLNAGFGSLGPFDEADPEHEARMVRLNCLAVVDLARQLVPDMRARGRGQIIVISSAAAWHPVPFMATYAATKAFELHFVRALAEELRGSGVGVLAVCPGPTDTEFSAALSAAGRRAPGWPKGMPIDTAPAVVTRSLAAANAGRTVVATGRIAQTTHVATRLIPLRWTLRIVGAVHRRRARIPAGNAHGN